MAVFEETAGLQMKVMMLFGVLQIGSWRRLRFFLFSVTTIIFACFLTTVLKIQGQFTDIEQQLMSFGVVGPVIEIIGRFWVFRLRIRKIQMLFEELDSMAAGYTSSRGAEVYLKSVSITKWANRVMSGVYSLAIFIFVSQPLYYGRLVRPFHSFFPSVESEDLGDQTFQIIYETISVFMVGVVAIFVDILPIIILLLINGHLEGLGQDLIHLPISPKEDWEKMLKQSVENYKRLRKICRNYEDTFSSLYLFQIGFLCINLCTASIALSFMHDNDYAAGVSVNIIMIWGIFGPLFAGNLILVTSENLKFQLYSTDWPNLSPAVSRKGLSIFMEVLKQPIQLSFGGVFRMDLETFTEIMKLAFRLYTMAGYFIEREKK